VKLIVVAAQKRKGKVEVGSGHGEARGRSRRFLLGLGGSGATEMRRGMMAVDGTSKLQFWKEERRGGVGSRRGKEWGGYGSGKGRRGRRSGG
jgi:hypothetical protein